MAVVKVMVMTWVVTVLMGSCEKLPFPLVFLFCPLFFARNFITFMSLYKQPLPFKVFQA